MDATREPLKVALIAYAVVAVAVALLVRLDFEVQLVGHVGSALVAVTLLYSPLVVGWWRKQELADYGFRAEPLGRGLLFAGISLAIVVPLFVGGYLVFYEVVCDVETFAKLAPPGMCRSFTGWDQLSVPVLDMDLAEFALVQLIVVALPEELFFRGCLLYLLEKAIPPKRRILGGGVGWALIISAAMFALIHLPKDGDARALATFFPGLWFGWMRSATGSILAPTVCHASSNVLVRIIDQMVVR